MVLKCPDHGQPLSVGFVCPEGHRAHAINMMEVLVECAGILGQTPGGSAVSGNEHEATGAENAA